MTQRARVATIFLAACTVVAGTPASSSKNASIERLVAARKAVETVYWRHRIWPEVNPGPKPSLDSVLNDRALRAMATDGLRKTAALAARWNRPITAEQIQAEIDRMAAKTRSPEILRELHRALGNDPFLVAETLARPHLADRLIRQAFARDERLHAEARERAEQAIAATSDLAAMARNGGRLSESIFVRASASRNAPPRAEDSRAIEMEDEDWDRLVDSLAATFEPSEMPEPRSRRLPTGKIGGLQEDSTRFYVSLIDRAGDHRIEIRSVSWPKRSFEAWWQEVGEDYAATLEPPKSAYHLPSLAANPCLDDTWTEIHRAIPYPRWDHSVVWTGSEMIVWGGQTGSYLSNTGDRYNPATDTWSRVRSDETAPSPREQAMAVWTGTEMIIWSGRWTNNTGGRYNPVSDTWTPTRADGTTPTARYGASAIWTGNTMIVWGGHDHFGNDYYNTGGRYNPGTDTWLATRSDNTAPLSRAWHSAVWTGTEMIIWGGAGGPSNMAYRNSGGRYDPVSDTWTPTSIVGTTPAGRYRHGAVWADGRMIVWGGRRTLSTNPPVNEYFTSGGRYNPATNQWTPTSLTNAPVGREFPITVWTGTEVLVWGGQPPYGFRSGGRYDPVGDLWSSMPDYPTAFGEPPLKGIWTGSELIVWGNSNAKDGTGGRYSPATNSWIRTAIDDSPPGRGSHTAIWTGSEMIIFGGGGGFGGTSSNDGARYDPATDTWTPTRRDATTPSARYDHSAVWTGTEMIVWGGGSSLDGDTNTGGRYSPVTDTWVPTSIVAETPSARDFHTAVWTGSRMIVWGGFGSPSNSGGVYDPATDSWTPTRADATAPAGRARHTAVWTGSEMIVFGGDVSLFPLTLTNSGGRYDPGTDSWTPTQADGTAPQGRSRHTAVWTGAAMLTWGGITSPSNFARSNTGSVYDPQSDLWSGMAQPAFLAPRNEHTAVWTGKEMIVWGGTSGTSAPLSTGGLYDPIQNTWSATRDDATTPVPRGNHRAVWAGNAMIVWGGGSSVDTGAAYCATTCVCDDGDDCTLDHCDMTGVCHHSPLVLWEPQPVTFSSDVTFAWPITPDGTHWNSYRGAIPSGMMGGRMPGVVYDHSCFESADEFGDGPTLSVDSSVPPLGTAWYYLVTGESYCEGPMGRDSSGEPIPNMAPCPTPP